MTASYLYLFLTLERLQNAHGALATELNSDATRLGGCELLGQFAPQLGWANNEAALLLRLPDTGGDGALSFGGLVSAVRTDSLLPTIRPTDDSRPKPGGIHVHRWFEVDVEAVDEFVTLSSQGWATFETLFDAKIFGLFRAEPTDADRAAGVSRLLLITRYGDHGVWEASRDPTSEAMQIFLRRQQLTRRSWAASTRLVG